MASKKFAITVGNTKVGWSASDATYPDALLQELGIDDVTDDLSGVNLRAKPVDYDVPVVVIQWQPTGGGKVKSSRLFCAPGKYATVIGDASTLIGQEYKTGKILGAHRPTRRIRI